MIVNDWVPPAATLTPPFGLIVPPAPAEAVIVKYVPGDSFAHHELQRLELAPVLPSSAVAVRAFAYSCSDQIERSSDGSTCTVP